MMGIVKREFEKLDNCLNCNEPRYQNNKILNEVLCYFPLKSRLQKLCMSTHTACDRRWHKDKRIDDDVMLHRRTTKREKNLINCILIFLYSQEISY